MTKNDPNTPHHGGWKRSLFIWGSAVLILCSTYGLVFVPGITSQEWAAEITFIVAHLVAAEIIMSSYRQQ